MKNKKLLSLGFLSIFFLVYCADASPEKINFVGPKPVAGNIDPLLNHLSGNSDRLKGFTIKNLVDIDKKSKYGFNFDDDHDEEEDEDFDGARQEDKRERYLPPLPVMYEDETEVKRRPYVASSSELFPSTLLQQADLGKYRRPWPLQPMIEAAKSMLQKEFETSVAELLPVPKNWQRSITITEQRPTGYSSMTFAHLQDVPNVFAVKASYDPAKNKLIVFFSQKLPVYRFVPAVQAIKEALLHYLQDARARRGEYFFILKISRELSCSQITARISPEIPSNTRRPFERRLSIAVPALFGELFPLEVIKKTSNSAAWKNAYTAFRRNNWFSFLELGPRYPSFHRRPNMDKTLRPLIAPGPQQQYNMKKPLPLIFLGIASTINTNLFARAFTLRPPSSHPGALLAPVDDQTFSKAKVELLNSKLPTRYRKESESRRYYRCYEGDMLTMEGAEGHCVRLPPAFRNVNTRGTAPATAFHLFTKCFGRMPAATKWISRIQKVTPGIRTKSGTIRRKRRYEIIYKIVECDGNTGQWSLLRELDQTAGDKIFAACLDNLDVQTDVEDAFELRPGDVDIGEEPEVLIA